MKIKITADSVIDLSREQLTENNITLIPLFITLGGTNFVDGVDVLPTDIYKYVAETNQLPKTAAVSIETFRSNFKKFIDEGYDAVIHFNISSDMSASHQNAKLAADEVGNVYVIDSRNLSTGVGLLVLYACDLIKQGLTAQEIFDKVTKRIPYVQASFVVDKLDYLYKGGRCSSLVLLGANLLSIKPTILVKDGKMIVGKKYVGTLKKAVTKYVVDILNTFDNPDYTRIFITHTEINQAIIDLVKDIVQEKAHFAEIYDTQASCTITSHCGPGTLGILYINDGGELK